MALTQQLTDTFDDNSRDSAKWIQFGASLGTLPSQSNGQLVFTTSTTNGYGGYDSAPPFSSLDLTGSYVVIQLVNAGNQALASLEVQPFGLVLDVNNTITWLISGNTLFARKKVATVASTVLSVAYNSTNHQWLRIRESLGTIFYDTSTDGATWVNFTTLTNPFAVTSLQTEISVGTFSNELSATTVLLDNYNIVPHQMTVGNIAPGQNWMRQFSKSKRRPYYYLHQGATVYTQNFTPGLSFTGATNMRTSKPLTGGLSFIGAVVKRTIRAFTGILSFTGTFTKVSLYARALTGVLSFTGSFSKRTARSLSASLSFTGTLLKFSQRALTGALSFTATLTKRLTRALTASVSFTGALAKISLFHQTFTATLSFVGSILSFHTITSIFRPISIIISSFKRTSTESSDTNVVTTQSHATIEEITSKTNIDNIEGSHRDTTIKSDSNERTIG